MSARTCPVVTLGDAAAACKAGLGCLRGAQSRRSVADGLWPRDTTA